MRGGLSEFAGGDATPTVLVPGWWIADGRVQLGDQITLTSGALSEKFTVAVGRLSDSGVTSGDTLVTTAAALNHLAPHASDVVVWGAVDQDADAARVVGELNTPVAQQPSVYVNGAVAERGSMQATLGTVTTVATGLLATVGALVGLVLGLVYGWAGAATTFHDIGRGLVLTIPWARVGAVLLLAVAAGALASVLPARRAVKAMPVAALGEE
ncbi:MAG: hypothetical protein ABI382_10205 [Nakamurella sp.]